MPFQAPPDKPQFVGRIDALSDLIVALTGESEPQICCIVGMGGAAFASATLDAEASNVNAERVQIESDDTRVVVDFQGLEYDDTTFVKVDLEFAESA